MMHPETETKSLKAKHWLAGKEAEQQALEFLLGQGLRWQLSNYRCRLGELDHIFWDQDTLVIVEVRYRKNNLYGGAAASISRQKQARIIHATQHYVIMHKLHQVAIRFDVIAITANQSLQWIKNAFQT